MYILPGNDYKNENLKFAFNLTSFTNETLEFQLYFDDPNFVSSTVDKD